MLKFIIIFICLLVSQISFAQISKHFPKLTDKAELLLEDKVSAEKNNTKIYALYNQKKLIGFMRPISTTTGCNSACLPLNYETYYSLTGEYIGLFSESGLTKINHEPMTTEDLSRLDLILAMAPAEFSIIKHPKELTDAISGATFKRFEPLVVKGAAYSTLRIHLYNQETLLFLKKWLKNQ